ncbi:hypothetical protein ACKZDW_11655 [Ralstonia syzygii subsp. celebesensis]|uniref:hypothetical protein n=1 Tax=Ralstonia syzygii TaxID=28097 RepID=UPI001300D30F|nr:hypothetical protein [Ralstonia syzygii]
MPAVSTIVVVAVAKKNFLKLYLKNFILLKNLNLIAAGSQRLAMLLAGNAAAQARVQGRNGPPLDRSGRQWAYAS